MQAPHMTADVDSPSTLEPSLPPPPLHRWYSSVKTDPQDGSIFTDTTSPNDLDAHLTFEATGNENWAALLEQ